MTTAAFWPSLPSRAHDLEAQSRFARLLHETLNTEMELHRSYCAKFGVTREDLEATEAAPTTVSYTSFLLSVAHQGTYQELAASLLPCQWGYWEIGDRLSRQGPPENAPLLCRVDSNVFVARVQGPGGLGPFSCRWAGRPFDGGGRAEDGDGLFPPASATRAFFWDMAYNMEQWLL